jgi:hypothetical protein
MTYGNHKIRMSGTKKAASFSKSGGQLIGTKDLTGNKPFRHANHRHYRGSLLFGLQVQ